MSDRSGLALGLGLLFLCAFDSDEDTPKPVIRAPGVRCEVCDEWLCECRTCWEHQPKCHNCNCIRNGKGAIYDANREKIARMDKRRNDRLLDKPFSKKCYYCHEPSDFYREITTNTWSCRKCTKYRRISSINQETPIKWGLILPIIVLLLHQAYINFVIVQSTKY